jgi:hypothetical protein
VWNAYVPEEDSLHRAVRCDLTGLAARAAPPQHKDCGEREREEGNEQQHDTNALASYSKVRNAALANLALSANP